MNKKGFLLVISTAVISGISIFINKFGVAVSNPNIFAFLKNLVVALIFAGIILSFENIKILKNLSLKKWLTLAIIGLIGGGIPFLLFFKGLSITSAAQGAFVHKTMFIFIAIMAVIFLKEKINKYFFIGGAMIVLGNLFILKNIFFIPNVGDLYVLSAVFLWAVENIISKKVLENTKAEIVAWARMSFGACFIFLYLFFSGQVQGIFKINLEQLGWIMVTSIFLFGYVLTWYKGISMIPVSTASAVLLLGLPITTILNLLQAGKINYQELAGNAIILVGVIMIGMFSFIEGKNKILFKKEETV